MNSTVSLIIKLVLGALVIFLGYKLYSIIQEPIQFEELKERRYDQVKNRLEQIREAQKTHRDVYNEFADDLDELIAFVDTGRKPLIERKDSSFMYYNETYQKEMQKDTIITTILGYERVKNNLFGADFDTDKLRYIPFSEEHEFMMEAGKIKVNDVVVPVFEAKAPDSLIFTGKLDKYSRYIDKDHALTVGSLVEPSLSGNW